MAPPKLYFYEERWSTWRDKKPRDEFFARPLKRDGTCLLWEGYKNSAGYGVFRIKKIGWMAHRLSWELHNSKNIPKGKVIMHLCDRPACINPKHLRMGTQGDNNKDTASKGRTSRGEKHPCSSMKAFDVSLIKYLGACGVKRPKLISLFNAPNSSVYKILAGDLWKSVPELPSFEAIC